MNRLQALFERLQSTYLDEHGNPRELLYSEINEALEGAKVTEGEILQGLRRVVIAHIAAGTVVYAEQGGPEIVETSLQLQPGRELLGLYNAILEAQGRLQAEEERREWLEAHEKMISEMLERGCLSQEQASSQTSSESPSTVSTKTEDS